MRAIFINSVNQEISEVELSKEVLEDLERLLKAEIVGMGNFINKDHMLYVDAGIIPAKRLFFLYEGLPPVTGNGVILGIAQTGEDKACTLSLEEVKAKVRFLTFQEMIDLISK